MDNKQEEISQVFLPKLGESITTATIVKWLKKKGDIVELDEPLLEVSTDKVNSEIPSPFAGVLDEIFASEEQEKEVGDLLCVIAAKQKKITNQVEEKKIEKDHCTSIKTSEPFLSPAVLRLMGEFNLQMQDLELIPRSGSHGRITKQDLENYLQGKTQKIDCPKKKEEISTPFEKIKMSAVRKSIAENLSKSFYTAPHATLVQELDMTKVMLWIKNNKEKILKDHNIKITPTAFIVYAITKAIEQFPLINSTLDADTIIVKKNINIGIAVSVDQTVLVPVVKDAQKLSIIDLAREIQNLAFKAKTHHLQMDDVKEGSVTLTNFGMSGTLIGIPIIRHPEAAIIGAGAITKKVIVLENDSFGIREMMYLSLTFDHRLLDGMYGCGFLAEIKKILDTADW